MQCLGAQWEMSWPHIFQDCNTMPRYARECLPCFLQSIPHSTLVSHAGNELGNLQNIRWLFYTLSWSFRHAVEYLDFPYNTLGPNPMGCNAGTGCRAINHICNTQRASSPGKEASCQRQKGKYQTVWRGSKTGGGGVPGLGKRRTREGLAEASPIWELYLPYRASQVYLRLRFSGHRCEKPHCRGWCFTQGQGMHVPFPRGDLWWLPCSILALLFCWTPESIGLGW